MSVNRSIRLPRWAMGVMGTVTLLAAAILVIAVVLGLRAGQQQYELRSRQQVGIALQKALDLRADGLLREAMQEYQNVLILDPTNAIAQEGIQSLLQMAQGGQVVVADAAPPPVPTAIPQASDAGSAQAPAAQAPATPAPIIPTVVIAAVPTGVSSSDGVLRPGVAFPTRDPNATVVTPPPTVAPGSLVTTAVASTATPIPLRTLAFPPAELEQRAQAAYRAGRWQEAVELLIQWQTIATAEQRPTVDELLFDAYLNLATEKDNEDNLQAALTLYDRALLLRPDAASVRAERNLVSQYLEVLSVDRANPARSIELLTTIYATEPSYRDVRARLQVALVADGDRLIAAGDWCTAAQRYDTLAEVSQLPDLLLRRDQIRTACDTGVPPASLAASLPVTATLAGTQVAGSAPAASATPVAPAQPVGSGPTIGRLLYSVRDPVNGVTNILAQPADGGPSALLVENGAQPALRNDGVRIAYRNLRQDQGGISAFDPATGVFFRITDYTEDISPSWEPQGSRVVFASNREGDRRWRIYTAWAEERGAVTMLAYGESPAWHPGADLIAHRGCDDTGNGCGIWLMDSSGSNRRPLTTVPADTRPAWAPGGRVVVFMSDGRDGNPEIYRVDVATGQVARLTDNPAIDTLPAVSPDGQWIAYISNMDGAWKIYAMPVGGGVPTLIAPVKGDLGDWHSQSLQWVY